jgi:hypothetical protein
MEDQVSRNRRRVPRKKTLGERIERLIVAPHLPRARRNQRLAIVAMVVLLGAYLLVWPVLSDMFGGGSTQTTSPSAPAPAKLRNKK